jgi:acyl dehydratase
MSTASHPLIPANSQAERIYSWDVQRAFARASGDTNPMHMDPLAARRTQAGVPVVHGVDLLLGYLEHLALHFEDAARIRNVSVRFLKFVEVGETVAFHIEDRDGDTLHGKVSAGGVDVAVIAAAIGAEVIASQPWTTSQSNAPAQALDISFAEAAKAAGTLHLGPECLELKTMYPAAAERFGLRIAALAGLSRLVGMICPGLHSIFSGLAVDFVASAGEPGAISYKVASASERHRTIAIDAVGAGVAGKVRTLMRLPPLAQPTYAELTSVVRAGEFAGASALVVGASRGLGELTAKLIAAGGGHVIATYAVGKADCERLAEEIRQGGGRCDIVQYDALSEAGPAWGTAAPRSLYYFATTQIFRRRGREFVPEFLRSFHEMYVTAFDRICRALYRANGGSGAVFYPSTVFVEERPAQLIEYAMAKQSGEMLCSQFATMYPGMPAVVERLPKLLTDQTNVVADMHQKLDSAVDVLLPIIRRVESLARVPASDAAGSDTELVGAAGGGRQ